MSNSTDAEGPRIVLDGEPLSPEWVPSSLLGRGRQITELASSLSPMRQAEGPLNTWLHGPPGAGKTVLARHAVGQGCPAGGSRLGLYVNCWQYRTLYSVLQAIINELRILGAEAQDTNVKLHRIRQALRGRPLVIILDAIHCPLPAQRNEIIYGLLNLPNTGLICLAANTQALALLGEGVRSKLSPIIVRLVPYSRTELQRILADRAYRGLAPDSWSPAILDRIAGAAAGDARRAIQMLRQAATLAEERGRSKLDGRMVGTFARQWQALHREQQMAVLTEHERIIRRLAEKHQPVSCSSLVRIYVSHCSARSFRPVARRTFSKYLSRLISAGLLSVSPGSSSSGGRIVRVAMA